MIAPVKGGLHGLFQRDRWRLVIAGFFDDSGKESDLGNRFVVLAGFVTTDWDPFHRLWMRLLFKHDLPGIHMKEILGHAKKKGWDFSKLNSILAEFIGAIRETHIVGFGVGVDMEAWRLIDPEIRKRFGDAQIFCCSRIMRRIMDRLETLGLQGEEISVTFDRDFEFARRRLRLFEELHKRYPQIRANVAQIAFSDSQRFYPLQAADLLAWETRRELVNRTGVVESTTRWKELMAALPSGQIEFAAGEFWTKAWFDEEIPKLLPPLRDQSV